MSDNTRTLRMLIREYLFVSLPQACAESLVSEQLHVRFHRLHQSNIDEELIDVIRGLEAPSHATRYP